MRRSFTLLLITLALAGATSAQQRPQAAKPVFSPAQVISQPKVKTPPEAKRSGIGGEVTVRVTVDAAGNVTSVDSVNGPGAVCDHVDRPDVKALRDAARAAAIQTKFAPASTGGVAEASTTVIRFNFEGDKDRSDNYMIAGKEPPPSKGDRGYAIAASESSGSETPIKGETKAEDVDTVSGGVVNGKANELPRPEYPPAARAVRATGSVPVQVLIDENGKVFLAYAVSGHPLLKNNAVASACGARFQPTLLAGRPVRVAGIITYNFVP